MGAQGFRFGATSSSIQTEGGHPAADWSRWEASKRAPESADGNGFATNFHDDLALIASLGITDVRITTEWARIEPVEGKTDAEGLDRYRDVLAHVTALGLRPWVTLVSTSLPGWFSDDGGSFGDERARGYHWMRHVDRCAEAFGEYAAGFTPIDDPVGWAIRGYPPVICAPGRVKQWRCEARRRSSPPSMTPATPTKPTRPERTSTGGQACCSTAGST